MENKMFKTLNEIQNIQDMQKREDGFKILMNQHVTFSNLPSEMKEEFIDRYGVDSIGMSGSEALEKALKQNPMNMSIVYINKAFHMTLQPDSDQTHNLFAEDLDSLIWSAVEFLSDDGIGI